VASPALVRPSAGVKPQRGHDPDFGPVALRGRTCRSNTATKWPDCRGGRREANGRGLKRTRAAGRMLPTAQVWDACGSPNSATKSALGWCGSVASRAASKG